MIPDGHFMVRQIAREPFMGCYIKMSSPLVSGTMGARAMSCAVSVRASRGEQLTIPAARDCSPAEVVGCDHFPPADCKTFPAAPAPRQSCH
jgi:hypothetical protein